MSEDWAAISSAAQFPKNDYLCHENNEIMTKKIDTLADLTPDGENFNKQVSGDAVDSIRPRTRHYCETFKKR